MEILRQHFYDSSVHLKIVSFPIIKTVSVNAVFIKKLNL